MDNLDDGRLAGHLASQAGQLLLQVRKELADASPQERKDEGDRRAQVLLAQLLAEARPDDAVLSEEAADDLVRLTADRVWIIDPLDGTREFSELDRDDWAVHVALWQRGDLVAGAVDLPAQGVTHTTHQPLPLTPASGGRPRFVVSRTRPPAILEPIVGALEAELVPMGSAGAKAMAVVDGRADVYLHSGGQYEWDSAAPVAVARAAGLHASRIDGSPLEYNRRDPLLPDLLICRPELADEVLRLVAESGLT